MPYIFLLLSFVSICCLIVGLIKPSLLTKLFINKFVFSRKSVATIFTLFFFIFIIFVGVTAPETDANIVNSESIEIENSEKFSLDADSQEIQEINEPSDEEIEAINISPSQESIPTPSPSPTPPPSLQPNPKPAQTQTPKPTISPSPVSQPEPPQPPAQTTSSCQEGQVNINSASVEELTRIIHIDVERSQQMLQLRPFSSVDAMTRINGIGQVRLNEIKNQGTACT